LANEYGNKDIALLLKKYGAKNNRLKPWWLKPIWPEE